MTVDLSAVANSPLPIRGRDLCDQIDVCTQGVKRNPTLGPTLDRRANPLRKSLIRGRFHLQRAPWKKNTKLPLPMQTEPTENSTPGKVRRSERLRISITLVKSYSRTFFFENRDLRDSEHLNVHLGPSTLKEYCIGHCSPQKASDMHIVTETT